MTNKYQKKPDEVKGGFSPVTSAITGAIIGAGVAVAGTMALKDEKNREKIKEMLTNAKDQAVDFMETVQKRADDKKTEIEDELVKKQKTLTDGTKSAKDSLRHKINVVKKGLT